MFRLFSGTSALTDSGNLLAPACKAFNVILLRVAHSPSRGSYSARMAGASICICAHRGCAAQDVVNIHNPEHPKNIFLAVPQCHSLCMGVHCASKNCSLIKQTYET